MLHPFGVEEVSLLLLLLAVFVLLGGVYTSRGAMFERKQRKLERVFLDVLSDSSVADIQF